MKFETKAIHTGLKTDPTTGSVVTPIYQTSTYMQEAPGVHKGYEYARTHNLTREVLEQNLAAIENGKYGIAYGSGLAATDAVMKLFNPGDEIISTSDLYGGTYRAFTKIYERYGLKFHFVPMDSADRITSLINPNTKLIWIETPTNPMLNIIDIEQMTAIARKHNIWTVVDNTFASPYLQTPLDLGADLVLHSATKYLGGHSDTILGAVVTRSDELADQLRFMQNATGAVPGPLDCFLVTRGIKTLALRVERACMNAERIAEFLRKQPKVKKVFYPGFSDHPNHEVASRQMKHFGAMISFTLEEDSLEAGTKVLSNTHLFILAESLGGVESLIGHPPTMTHASIPKEERYAVGMTDSLIRLSVGVENADDLIEDLQGALAHLG